MKPLLDEKGCDQTLGIFQGKEFLNFLFTTFSSEFILSSVKTLNR
jgi:hypothetical protein